MNINNLSVETEDVFASLLDLAANNDVKGFKRSVDGEPSIVDEVGLWYGRQKGSRIMVLLHRTPLMVAATYGSIDVLKLIISLPEVDVNRPCSIDKTTALHCAASSGSVNAVDAVKLLLEAGADPNQADAYGCHPFDVIIVSPKCYDMKTSLEVLLAADVSDSTYTPLSMSHGNGSSSSPSELVPSPTVSPAPERREYPVDLTLPDITNTIYSSDEFRMFSFKVRPCSRAYSHDWTECPFVHPGENARRRDPRKYHYSCVPCPDFRKGACRRGDMCQYAHGVFESWLHPAQYRTRLCKDGTACDRRVCFFAHKQEELRPLYVSNGSAVHSPRTSVSTANAMDFAATMNLLPGSPSSIPVMSPSPFTPPMSPSTNAISNMGWAQQNVPTLNLPGTNLHSSRLRSSLSARDIPTEDLNELALMSTNLLSRSARSKTIAPSSLQDIFIAESSSPRYSDQALASAAFSPTHKSTVLNQFQQQTILSPIKTNFSPRNVDNSLASFGIPSSGRMSPRSVEPISPMSSRGSILAQREMQKTQFRSLSSHALSTNAEDAFVSLDSTWPYAGFATGSPCNLHEECQLKRSSSFDLVNNGEGPDLSWVQSLVKESPQEMNEKSAPVACSKDTGTSSGASANMNSQFEQIDQSALGAWLEQMHLDQLMAQ
ncbi:Zinc finger CCCH domain-containing protein 30 [Forsythia ovata]|uniref:Zinc finger CCCH domain-containing protein 30 n=1 Tax=Forsythia ovata TaxID=205694 RepID=A0ABD1R3U0_9LAMI